MTAQIIDGKLVAAAIKESLKPRIDALKAKGVSPGIGGSAGRG